MKQLNFFEPIEEQIKPPNGNKRLVDTGPQDEGSDYRIHVGYLTQHIYVFPTKSAQKYLAAKHSAEAKFVKQGEIITSKGYPAPISHIDSLVSILIPIDIYQKYLIVKNGMTTSEKGARATSIAVAMLKRNLVPLPVRVSVIEDKDLQIKGADILICSELKIQVKCDFGAGLVDYGGTGNVYLEVAECNPYKRY